MKTQQLVYAQNPLEVLPHIDLEITRPGTVQLGTVHFCDGQRAPADGSTSHREREISLLVEGKLEVVSGGVKHIVETGALLDIPPGEEHYTKALADSKIIYLLLG